MRWICVGLIAFGVIQFFATAGGIHNEQDASLWMSIGMVALGVGAIGLLVPMYNRLVAGKNRCHMAMSNVDVLLKRRFDLVGNLVAVVERYATHENTTFKEVAEYRSRATMPTSIAAKSDEVGRTLLPSFSVIAEAYPELKADRSFRQLFDQLKETEDGIASARVEYNRAVMDQNTRVSAFPDVLLARMFGFVEHSFFSASDDEKHVVSVQ